VSLTGLTIAITGSRRGSELAYIVESFNGRPYIAPTVGIEADLKRPDEAIIEFINRIVKQDVEYVIFMTGPGVFSLISIAKSFGMEENLIGALQKVTVVARSIKPQMALKKYGIRTDLVPQENTAKGISKLLENIGMLGKTIGILWHGEYTTQLREELYKAGAANVIEASIYRYSFELKKDGASILKAMGFNYLAPHVEMVIKLIEDIIGDKIDAITFTSPPSARDLFKIADINHTNGSLRDSLNTNVIVAAVGPSTKEVLEENGIIVDVIPQIFKMGPMIKSISDYVSLNNISKRNKIKKDNRSTL
jgi:uroporphyrinogen-III synthase